MGVAAITQFQRYAQISIMKNKIAILPALTVVTAILAIMSIFVFMMENRANISDNNREYLLDNTSQMAILVNNSLLHGLTNIQMLGNLTGKMLQSDNVDVSSLRQILDHSVFDFIEFTNRDGKNYNTTGGVSEARDRRYYQEAMKGNSGIELIFSSRATKETLLVFYSPVRYNGEIIGSLIGTYKETGHLAKLLTMDVFGYRAEAYLCNMDGLIIASNQGINTTEKISINTVLAPRLSEKYDKTRFVYSTETKIIPLEGNETGACLMGLKNFDWYIVQIFPEQANHMMVSNANRIGIVLAMFLIAILSILILLTYLILNRSRLEIQKALARAEAGNRAKSDFLFNMSHDIRTPMNAVMGFLQLLDEQQDNAGRRKEYIRKIRASSDLLLSMVNNVLEMSKIEKGKIALEETVCSMDQLVGSVCAVIGPKMREKSINFEIDINTRHDFICCDVAKIHEIFLNILNNASQFTPEGGKVSVRVTEIPSEKKGQSLFRTEIEDNGIGIAPEFIPHLFETFAREKNTTQSKTAGMGLGMAIVKKLVELMGGSIDVESEIGKGTKFIVTIPHRIPEEEEICKKGSGEKEDDFLGKRILLAEDNDFNADIATELLTEVGFKVERANDGDICVAMLERAENNYYDLVLMDIQMPKMDGYQATEAIRKMDNPSKSTIPIIAMTANTFEEDREKSSAAGIDVHLAKPIDVLNLLETLKTFSQR